MFLTVTFIFSVHFVAHPQTIRHDTERLVLQCPTSSYLDSNYLNTYFHLPKEIQCFRVQCHQYHNGTQFYFSSLSEVLKVEMLSKHRSDRGSIWEVGAGMEE